LQQNPQLSSAIGANHVPQPQIPSAPAQESLPVALADQYKEQLAQMREMGITDSKLAVMALRVSDGDVATAVELIFSGWTGEGAEPLE